MKKITQQEFKGFPVDRFGYKQYPTGDYSEIKTFGERCIFGPGSIFGNWCSFGEGCRFGEGCIFGNWCSFGEGCIFGKGCSFEGLANAKYFACDRIGSNYRKTYFFKSDEGYFVRAGCFFGTFDEFVERVKSVHGGTKHEKAYLAAVELAKIVLG